MPISEVAIVSASTSPPLQTLQTLQTLRPLQTFDYPEYVSEARKVYSTDSGRLCPKCGWPIDNCQCSSQFARDESVPARVVAKLRLEKSGRGGKTVTVVYDLPRNQPFLKALATELKKACGAGGAVVDDTVEIQGDLRDRIRVALQKKGWTVKG